MSLHPPFQKIMILKKFSFQAVLSAPCDEKTGYSKELAIALANRSAVLFSLKAYHLALDDIKLAFECGYPEELHFKLLDRKAKILMFFKQFVDARDTFKELMKALGTFINYVAKEITAYHSE